jgi:hypothetical protein
MRIPITKTATPQITPLAIFSEVRALILITTFLDS